MKTQCTSPSPQISEAAGLGGAANRLPADVTLAQGPHFRFSCLVGQWHELVFTGWNPALLLSDGVIWANFLLLSQFLHL